MATRRASTVHRWEPTMLDMYMLTRRFIYTCIYYIVIGAFKPRVLLTGRTA